MKEMTINETMKLVKSGSKPAISIYLRTDHHEPNSAARIKSNLQRLYQTVESLIARTYDRKTKERLLGSLKRSLASLRLARGRGGIAIYHSEDFTGVVKIPTATRDLAIAAESYHLKPVLRCMQLRRRYYLLALRKKYAELVLVSPDGPPRRIERVEIFAKSEKVNDGFDAARIWARAGLRIRKQKEIRQAMEFLNRRFEGHWFNEQLPLLVAGTHQFQDEFRKACNYMHLLGRGLSGQIDDLDQLTLVGMANDYMELHFAEIDALAVVNFRKASASGLTSTDLREISQAAAQGQIQSLLVAEDKHLWGHLDRKSGSVQLLSQKTEARSDDVLDDLAELTILKGGQVTVLPSVQMPNGAPIAAILRWSNSPAISQIRASIRAYATPTAAQHSLRVIA